MMPELLEDLQSQLAQMNSALKEIAESNRQTNELLKSISSKLTVNN